MLVTNKSLINFITRDLRKENVEQDRLTRKLWSLHWRARLTGFAEDKRICDGEASGSTPERSWSSKSWPSSNFPEPWRRREFPVESSLRGSARFDLRERSQSSSGGDRGARRASLVRWSARSQVWEPNPGWVWSRGLWIRTGSVLRSCWYLTVKSCSSRTRDRKRSLPMKR